MIVEEAWLLDAAVVAGRLDTDPETGLTTGEAAARLQRAGPNRLDPQAQVPAWRRLAAQFADPLVYLVLAAVAISPAVWVIGRAGMASAWLWADELRKLVRRIGNRPSGAAR